MNKIIKKVELSGREFSLEKGWFAQQSTSAVMARHGDTVVLTTVVSAPLRQELDYFPLSVEYQERLYAGGKIKGSRWIKREGKPSDEEILAGRLIDRSIRPLFPKDYKKDVQVTITVLSVDLKNSPEIVAANAVSAALLSSSIPFNGPVAVVRVAHIDGGFVVNPTDEELEKSDLDLIVSCTKDAILMIEAGANQISEEKMIDAIKVAQKEADKMLKLQEDFAKEEVVEKEKFEKIKVDPAVSSKVKKQAEKEISEIIKKLATKEKSYEDLKELKDSVLELFEGDETKQASYYFEELLKSLVRKILLSGKRLDGRKTDELRELGAQVSILPRTHGSAIFQRGQTQALTITTLGAPNLELLIESAEGEESKRYIHHYSMPPYSTGETGRIGTPSRREIGHGALAERALLPVIPGNEDFPYTIRVVTEILSSNGSTSMASVCGSTLSLMDAGVPINAPVAGIAMGIVVEDEKNYVVLTDIVGIEDGNGDMDFKVAGTKDGITALQLDVKTLNLTLPMLENAFEQARQARLKILEVMLTALGKPKEDVSEFAPKIKAVRIPVDRIGELIGPGGKNIKGIIAKTGAQIDVDDEGKVSISATDKQSVEDAIQIIEAFAKEVVPDEIYDGEVKRIQQFGAFIEILPGKEGLVHVSDMSQDFVKDPSDILKINQKVKVRVKEIDELGRINLSMILDKSLERKKSDDRRGGRSEGRRDQRGGGRRYGGRNFRNENREYSKGPHFPTSRLLQDVDKR
jgi:polyribonucleotide nucleotidyltransferase